MDKRIVKIEGYLYGEDHGYGQNIYWFAVPFKRPQNWDTSFKPKDDGVKP